MSDVNQWLYFQRFVPRIDGPVLEIGSKQYSTLMSIRTRLAHPYYTGIDLEPGEGVDCVGDLAISLCGLKPHSFSLIICCSLLEHVEKPWHMAQNITQLLSQNGIVYITVPWVWRFHSYPDDYWRFSWRGIETLFPELVWSHKFYSTNVAGEFFPAAPGHDDKLHYKETTRKYLPYMQLHMLGRRRA